MDLYKQKVFFNPYTSKFSRCPGKFRALDTRLQERLCDPDSCSFPNQTNNFTEHRQAPLNPNTENHLPGYNFCGPGTQVKARLERGDFGVNELDNACRVHDVEYTLHAGNKLALMESDQKLAYVADQISRRLGEDLAKSQSGFAKFLSVFGVGSASTFDKLLNCGKVSEKLAADAVKNVFRGKGILDYSGLMDPVSFAEGLDDKNLSKEEKIKLGVEMYKKYIINKKNEL